MYKLGEAIPNDTHAVSVSLPEWRDVIGYEECSPRVVEAMQLGYPRFVYHPLIKELCAAAEDEFASEGEFALCLPSKKVADWCVDFCGEGKIEEFKSVYTVILPENLRQKAKDFWQHSGFIISSRQAQDVLAGNTSAAKNDRTIEKDLARISGADEEDVYLYPSGMAAIFAAYYIVTVIASDQRKRGNPERWIASSQAPRNDGVCTTQLGFPYVDTLKIQQKFGEHQYLSFDEYEKVAGTDAVFTEFPLNPLLDCVDFEELKKHLGDIPLVIDDTLSSWANFDALEHADIAVSSLTKFYSGTSDVLAGCLVLNKKSKHYDRFKAKLNKDYENLLYTADEQVLKTNGSDYERRIEIINKNTENLYDWLKTKADNFKIYYTKGNVTYEKFKKQGYGGIISLEFDTEGQAEKFYNALEVSKGPSLGTEYTLACPYTLLAHYNELEWAGEQGVQRHLVRISVGCENLEDLKTKFSVAMGTTVQ